MKKIDWIREKAPFVLYLGPMFRFARDWMACVVVRFVALGFPLDLRTDKDTGQNLCYWLYE